MIRVAKEGCDVTTEAGLQKTLEIAYANPGALLWTSLPSIAGCLKWRINETRPGGTEMREVHYQELLLLLEPWLQVARVVEELGGDNCTGMAEALRSLARRACPKGAE